MNLRSSLILAGIAILFLAPTGRAIQESTPDSWLSALDLRVYNLEVRVNELEANMTDQTAVPTKPLSGFVEVLINLTDVDFRGGDCKPMIASVNKGDPLLIMNGSGEIVALARLEAGSFGSQSCFFSFTTEVPQTAIYQFRLGDRASSVQFLEGSIYSYDELEAKEWRAAFSVDVYASPR